VHVALCSAALSWFPVQTWPPNRPHLTKPYVERVESALRARLDAVSRTIGYRICGGGDFNHTTISQSTETALCLDLGYHAGTSCSFPVVASLFCPRPSPTPSLASLSRSSPTVPPCATAQRDPQRRRQCPPAPRRARTANGRPHAGIYYILISIDNKCSTLILLST
jgi:hypothetical protein